MGLTANIAVKAPELIGGAVLAGTSAIVGSSASNSMVGK